jgi:hypothetical protein
MFDDQRSINFSTNSIIVIFFGAATTLGLFDDAVSTAGVLQL